MPTNDPTRPSPATPGLIAADTTPTATIRPPAPPGLTAADTTSSGTNHPPATAGLTAADTTPAVTIRPPATPGLTAADTTPAATTRPSPATPGLIAADTTPAVTIRPPATPGLIAADTAPAATIRPPATPGLTAADTTPTAPPDDSQSGPEAGPKRITGLGAPTRRAACAALVGLTAKADTPIAGGFVFESQNAGHAIRDRHGLSAPGRTVNTPVVIVGGGMAGLSAAWWLEKQGFRDFVVLELEKEAGGNSRYGQNEVSAYPWGAHYLPVPNADADLVRELCTELGLYADGRWDERWLCHAPQERLFLHGRWQEGLEPDIGLTAEDRRQFKTFDERIKEFRATGQFRIPMATGAPADSPLDKLSFRQWLNENGFKSQYLHWLADYSTRDDYGANSAETSAWAGIHYFAARDHEEKGPLTWPEGNGWILRRLLNKLGKYVTTGKPVVRIAREGNRWQVQAADILYKADAVIYAAPAFLLPYLDPTVPPVKSMTWSPWLVANLTLNRMPVERGSEPAWDNVIYASPSLGYVVSTHQNVQMRTEKTVLTYYFALSGAPPAQVRRDLLAADWNVWKERILADLERPHRDIRNCVTRIDIFRNGHAMIRPTSGFLANKERKSWETGRERFYWASADVSGFSIFEEAQYRGVTAARRALRALGRASR